MSAENISTKYFGNKCPECECEVEKLYSRCKNQKDKENMQVKCSECGTILKVRKVGKYFGVSIK